MLLSLIGIMSMPEAHAIKKKTAQRMCEGTWEDPCKDPKPAGAEFCCRNTLPAERMAAGAGKKVNRGKILFSYNPSAPLDAEDIAYINKRLAADPKLRAMFEGK